MSIFSAFAPTASQAFPAGPDGHAGPAVTEPGTLDPALLADALRSATDWLGVYTEEVNALNVYPVPDGDTGTNMHLTMQSVRTVLDTTDMTGMAQVARAMAYGSLLGARGNSGVILSQILKGFADSLRETERLDGAAFVRALEQGSTTGYAGVMTPVEGTILTVAREAAQGAREALDQDRGLTVGDALRAALAAGRASLARTPELLPILRQAGVVDSGGQGFLYVLDGMLARLDGRPLPAAPTVQSYAAESFENEEFGYCTEFLLEDVRLPIEQVRQLVEPFGDSLLVVGAEGFVKGHIHTDQPDALLATVARHGRMVRSKVEDMAAQHTEILAMAGAASRIEAPAVGLVAVASGEGLVRVFRSLGARVVSGGQTQNPSVQDIADAVGSLEAPDVIVLPNNKNVLLAAEQAREVVVGKTVHVVPTRTLGQGLGAALAFDPGADLAGLADSMAASAARVTTLEVTRASRDATIDGRPILENEVIGLVDDQLVMSGGTAEEAVVQMLLAAFESQEIVTVFTRSGADPQDVELLRASIARSLPTLDLEFHAGAPELYDYLVTLE